MNKVNIAILISGKGSNAQNIVKDAALGLRCNFIVISSKENHEMEVFCQENKVEYVSMNAVFNTFQLLDLLKSKNIDAIVLAGYLKLIPTEIINEYQNKIVNLHPSLLPKFGGPGMYGSKVHQAVFDSKELYSGITIHYVNEEYDKGEIIAQHRIDIKACSSVNEIELKIKDLEKKEFPATLLNFVQNKL